LTSKGTIELLGILAVGRHGVLPEEQRRGQPFEIDLRLELDLAAAAVTDDLGDTVDYGLVAEAVVRTVELESFQLLERLADRIAGMCLSTGSIHAVEVTVRKLRPPLPVQIRTVGVSLRREAVLPAPPLAIEPGSAALDEVDETDEVEEAAGVEEPDAAAETTS